MIFPLTTSSTVKATSSVYPRVRLQNQITHRHQRPKEPPYNPTFLRPSSPQHLPQTCPFHAYLFHAQKARFLYLRGAQQLYRMISQRDPFNASRQVLLFQFQDPILHQLRLCPNRGRYPVALRWRSMATVPRPMVLRG